LAAGQLHLTAKGQSASSLFFAFENAEILSLHTSATEALDFGGAKRQLGMSFKDFVGPLRDISAETDLVLAVA
jgi:hypothetical protein